MIRSISLSFIFFAMFLTTSFAGTFSGELILEPEGCQQSDTKICKLGSELRYDQGNGLVWQTNKWTGNGKSGTTDGASIPGWAQWLIGDPYDSSYLKAAIVHDHYCYPENQVRTWQQTHRMFYDALIDLKIDKIKAKTMYYAVIIGGPRWNYLVPGENCGPRCLRVAPVKLYEDLLKHSRLTSIKVNEGEQYENNEVQTKIKEFNKIIKQLVDISPEDIEKLALTSRPDKYSASKKNANHVEPKKEVTFRLEKIVH